MAEQPEIEGQDIAEVFDEDNLDSDSMRLARDDEELNFDDMPDVYDATSAEGDADDDDAIIGDDLDDDQIVELSVQDQDENEREEDDDDFLAAESLDDVDEEEDDPDDVGLAYAGDLNTAEGAHSAAQRYESRTLSDEDLAELGYQDAPAENKSFEAPKGGETKQAEAERKAGEDERLDQGVEETFPASDPVSVKHIT
jgi:hypothetical protein